MSGTYGTKGRDNFGDVDMTDQAKSETWTSR